jgi:tyrosine-specific transport protein
MQAGTYGVLVLFGVIPAAMLYSERYWKTTLTRVRVVPEGRLLVLGVGGSAALIIVNELRLSLQSLVS